MNTDKINILIVCKWPLGGIRTYLKYYYSYFPKEKYSITLLAKPSHEGESVISDMKKIGVKVLWANSFWKFDIFFLQIFALLFKGRFDIIHSQGYLSAANTAFAKLFFKTYHVLTIHGMLEEKYFSGFFGPYKKKLLKLLLKKVDTFHGVGEDILNHFLAIYPVFKTDKFNRIIIRNGIHPQKFLEKLQIEPNKLKEKCSIDPDSNLFGFFGRFMPVKGFDYIINAVELLIQKDNNLKIQVICFGSGDYKAEYMADVSNKNLNEYFKFMPFQSDITSMIKICDAVLMPSLSEAYPMQSSEILCSGVPLIASHCMGLKEATKDTPAIQIPVKNSSALAEAMLKVINNPAIKDEFLQYQHKAAKRFDVGPLARELVRYFDEICLNLRKR
ncbi:MAG: glycosyltransferase family 4 protein [candidate division Zixibacteria bacterium]|nr:glycosyltransferase family 4 protein [candidate division Zixibacteria bacterium]